MEKGNIRMKTQYETLGSLLKDVVLAGKGYKASERFLELKAAAGSDEMHGDSISRGGAAVPEELLNDALRRRGDADPILSRVTRLQMRYSRLGVPARVDKNHASSVSGGLQLARRPETVEFDTNQIQMEKIEITAENLGGAIYVTDELLADSPFEMILERAFLDELSAVLLHEFLFGTGVGESLGVLNSPCLISIDTSSQTTSTVKGGNIQAMSLQCWHYDEAVWVANPDLRVQLEGAYVSFGNSDRALLTYEGGKPFLNGRPIFFSEQCASIGTQGDIVCGVWSEFLLGVRQTGKLESSIHVRFANMESTLRFTFRGSGMPWWRSTLVPKNGANELSPFTCLDTRTT
jgi:HK97 family phage major capsid protein